MAENEGRAGRSITLEEFFPAPGHKYLTDERIEAFRQRALDNDQVILPAFTVMEIVCDWRNMTADIEKARGLIESFDPTVGSQRTQAFISDLRGIFGVSS